MPQHDPKDADKNRDKRDADKARDRQPQKAAKPDKGDASKMKDTKAR